LFSVLLEFRDFKKDGQHAYCGWFEEPT
jgi:hypothetical protein